MSTMDIKSKKTLRKVLATVLIVSLIGSIFGILSTMLNPINGVDYAVCALLVPVVTISGIPVFSSRALDWVALRW
jgi:hypothetical protein